MFFLKVCSPKLLSVSTLHVRFHENVTKVKIALLIYKKNCFEFVGVFFVPALI